MPVTEVFAGIVVRNRDAAVEFYGRVAALDGHGVDHSPVSVVEATVRSVWIQDPDGNRLQIVQP